MRIAYVRVSSQEQNEARQVEALKAYDIDKWYIDKASGKSTDRPQLKELRSFILKGIRCTSNQYHVWLEARWTF